MNKQNGFQNYKNKLTFYRICLPDNNEQQQGS